MKNYEFDNGKGEFTIYNPETGKNWYNQLWNDMGYHMTVTHTGLVYSKYVDENGKIIVMDRFENNCLYIRDDDSGEFWNVGIMPSCTPVQNYKCVHGMNRTVISSEYKGIAASLGFAVSQKDTYEVWQLKLRNNSDREVNLSLFTGVEFTSDGFDQPAYYNADTTTETVYNEKCGAILCLMKNPYVPNDNCNGFIACSEPVAAYEGNFEKFIGTVGNDANPYIVRSGNDCTNSLCTVRRRGGVLQNKVTLMSGEEKTVYYILGLCKGEKVLEAELPAMKSECGALFEGADESGQKRFGSLRTQTPEPQINNIMNFWAQKQVSYCMIGKKAVRDNAQLAMAMLNFDADLAEKTLTECLEHQYIDGHAMLNWTISSDKNNLYSDPSMWLILSVCEYIKETGDIDFLDKQIRYEDADSESVYEHLKRAAEWYEKPMNLGKNGLPKIFYADWNDALNIPDDDAESVFMAMGVCLAFGELAELAEFIGDKEFGECLLAYKTRLAESANKSAYNGEYYVRAIGKYGNVGDKGSKGGNIYVNPQTWAILADIVPEDRLESVLKSIDDMETDAGIPICKPPYPEYDVTVGRMSGMLPGVYENAGIYNHACGFKIMADCKLGRADNALATLLKAIPDGKSNPSSITTTEPYVFVNCYLQHKSVEMMVGFSWQTGTSAWLLRDYYEGILGIKRTYEGLKITPCIPKNWDRVSAQRVFRGNLLEFDYENSGSANPELYVDGVHIEGDIIPLFNDNDNHSIKVKF